jgi:hypothetical protein
LIGLNSSSFSVILVAIERNMIGFENIWISIYSLHRSIRLKKRHTFLERQFCISRTLTYFPTTSTLT